MTETNVDEREKLQAILYEVRTRLNEIDKKEYEIRNTSRIGKYFRFKNSYSMPSKPEDYWWLYMKVIGVEERFLKTWKFQKDPNGEIKLESGIMGDTVGYEEISPEAFWNAWKELIAEINQHAERYSS